MQGNELLLLLGKAVSNGQAFELVTCLVLGKCLGLPIETDHRAAILVGQRLSTATRLDLVSELAGVVDIDLDQDQLRCWVASARNATAERNRVVHWAWHGDPASGEFMGVITKRGRAEPRDKQEIQAAITATRIAIEDGYRLLGLEVVKPEP